MKLRWLDASDLVQWRILRSEALRLYPEAFLTTLEDFEAQSDETVEKMLSYGKMLGVFSQDTLIGAGAFLRFNRPQTEHRAEIGAYYIAATHHGSGAADLLMTSLIQHGTDQAVSQLELFVWDGNTRAIRFYERHGFETVGRLPAAVIVDGIARDDLFMVKSL